MKSQPSNGARSVNRQRVSHTQPCMFTHDEALDLHEYPDHLARVQNVLRSAVDGGVQGVDPQVVIQRRKHVFELNRLLLPAGR